MIQSWILHGIWWCECRPGCMFSLKDWVVLICCHSFLDWEMTQARVYSHYVANHAPSIWWCPEPSPDLVLLNYRPPHRQQHRTTHNTRSAGTQNQTSPDRHWNLHSLLYLKMISIILPTVLVSNKKCPSTLRGLILLETRNVETIHPERFTRWRSSWIETISEGNI